MSSDSDDENLNFDVSYLDDSDHEGTSDHSPFEPPLYRVDSLYVTSANVAISLLKDNAFRKYKNSNAVLAKCDSTVQTTWKVLRHVLHTRESNGVDAIRYMEIFAFIQSDFITRGFLQEMKGDHRKILATLCKYGLIKYTEKGVIVQSTHLLSRSIRNFRNECPISGMNLLKEILHIFKFQMVFGNYNKSYAENIWHNSLRYDELIRESQAFGLNLCDNIRHRTLIGELSVGRSLNILRRTFKKFNSLFGCIALPSMRLRYMYIMVLLYASEQNSLKDLDCGKILEESKNFCEFMTTFLTAGNQIDQLKFRFGDFLQIPRRIFDLVKRSDNSITVKDELLLECFLQYKMWYNYCKDKCEFYFMSVCLDGMYKYFEKYNKLSEILSLIQDFRQYITTTNILEQEYECFIQEYQSTVYKCLGQLFCSVLDSAYELNRRDRNPELLKELIVLSKYFFYKYYATVEDPAEFIYRDFADFEMVLCSCLAELGNDCDDANENSLAKTTEFKTFIEKWKDKVSNDNDKAKRTDMIDALNNLFNKLGFHEDLHFIPL